MSTILEKIAAIEAEVTTVIPLSHNLTYFVVVDGPNTKK